MFKLGGVHDLKLRRTKKGSRDLFWMVLGDYLKRKFHKVHVALKKYFVPLLAFFVPLVLFLLFPLDVYGTGTEEQ